MRNSGRFIWCYMVPMGNAYKLEHATIGEVTEDIIKCLQSIRCFKYPCIFLIYSDALYDSQWWPYMLSWNKVTYSLRHHHYKCDLLLSCQANSSTTMSNITSIFQLLWLYPIAPQWLPMTHGQILITKKLRFAPSWICIGIDQIGGISPQLIFWTNVKCQ